MLILTRRINEALIIRNDITVTVLGIEGSQVKIGIEAPMDIDVHRDEVYQQMKNEE
jgi:carbon storage regulator